MTDLFAPLSFTRGPALKNRFMLAPLTNLQSHADGRLSDDEFHWLTLRAQGGFGLTMTCAAHVQAIGQGFPGQLGIYSDDHLEGLTRLAAAIKAAGSRAFVQLHHAGMRAPAGPDRHAAGLPVRRRRDRGTRADRCPRSSSSPRTSSSPRSARSARVSTASNCTAPTATSSPSS